MAKVAIFIDGSWLFANTPALCAYADDKEYRIDVGKLPTVLAEQVRQSVGDVEVDVVRTSWFASYPVNYDIADDSVAQARLNFFKVLREEMHFDVHAFPTNFCGRRLRRTDRAAADDFLPKEKYVDVALASSMMYMAAMPAAYDIAIAVIGDRDFVPMLQYVRRLGKRVAIASIAGSCASEYCDPADGVGIKDYDVIWLDRLLPELARTFEEHMLECCSPYHEGDRLVSTTFHPRNGRRFYCEECRTKHMAVTRDEPLLTSFSPADPVWHDVAAPGAVMSGKVKNLVVENGYGFISAEDGSDFFFHNTEISRGVALSDLAVGDAVEFTVKSLPACGRAGRIREVWRQSGIDRDKA